MDKIHAMKAFVCIAEAQSFTRAAEHLGLAKGNLSRQIQALENTLGVRLLQRTTRKVKLTHEGQRYYDRCCHILSTLQELDTLFHPNPVTLTGRLRVDMPTNLASHCLMPVLPQFLQHYPGIELELSCCDRPVDMLREGFDCIVRQEVSDQPGSLVRTVGYLPQINCASPDYLARFGTPTTLEILSQHAMVHYTPPSGVPLHGFEYYDGKTVNRFKTGGVISVNSMETYRSAGLAGLGIIQIPRVEVTYALDKGMLVEILPYFTARPRPLSLLWPAQRQQTQRVQVFIEWISQILKRYVI